MRFIRLFKIFNIKREERWLAAGAALVALLLNLLVILSYSSHFLPLSNHYWELFIHHFRVSGFDPITYSVVSEWGASYNVYRHPLLAFCWYPAFLLNSGLMWVFGINFAQFIVAAVQTICALYSYLFLYRIMREIIGLRRFDAALTGAFFFSFAYIMLSVMVPDHFLLSMTVLLMTLYIGGMCVKKGRTLTIGQTVLLFVLTAGISLNNRLKTFIAAWLVNGRRFFRLRYLIWAVIAPALLIWLFARMEYRVYVWPHEVARKEMKEKRKKTQRDRLFAQYRDTATVKDSALVAAQVEKIIAEKAKARAKAKAEKRRRQPATKTISKGEFMNWTDISTSRWDTAVENLFGEAIQLHRQHLLEDTLKTRPPIVRYENALFYAVEGIVVLLFLLGIVAGRHERLLWMALSFCAFDMALHMGLGFGINEVYIMSAHWMFVMPIATAYFLKKLSGRSLIAVRGLILLLAAWLWTYNGWLITTYLL